MAEEMMTDDVSVQEELLQPQLDSLKIRGIVSQVSITCNDG